MPALREKRPSPRARRRGAPGRPAPRGGGARRHREKLLRGAEAVGGGRRRRVGEARALLSPKSKVLGAVSRTRSPGSRGRLLRAGLRLLKETRQPAPALSLPPPRWDECAYGLGEAAAPWTHNEEEDQTPGPGARLHREHPPVGRGHRLARHSVLCHPSSTAPRVRSSPHRPPIADSLPPPPSSLPRTRSWPVPLPPPQPRRCWVAGLTAID